MKYIDEYRDNITIKALSEKIRKITSGSWRIMEVCGGQTHNIMKYNLESLLPPGISLIHGPGCPVCVTPVDMIDKAVYLASQPDIILVSYGDMLRVPGTYSDLQSCRTMGRDVRMIYSPLQAVKIAKENPDKKVVFFSVGFETTAPANAMSLLAAGRANLDNYFMLCSHVTIPAAIKLLLSNKENGIQGFLLPGHVCTVMGYEEYIQISRDYRIPAVVTGFEPADILNGIYALIKQLEDGMYQVENQYSRTVRSEGNLQAKAVMEQVFTPCHQNWRGIGVIPDSGLKIGDGYAAFDAEIAFGLNNINIKERLESVYKQKQIDSDLLCIAGKVLQGISKPAECPAFSTVCTPEHPLGAPMVSSEGACAAYYRYWKK